jgi:hypothetical protein
VITIDKPIFLCYNKDIKAKEIKQMKRTWTWTTANLILGDMVIFGAKVVYLQGKATLSQCSAADFLVRKYGFTTK